MRFGVLGPLEVTNGGSKLVLGGRKQQKILAALLLAEGQTVPLTRLVDVVWEVDPPASAEKQIRNAVSDLRRVLGPDEPLIETVSGGYLLNAGETLDAHVFIEKSGPGRDLAARNRVHEAITEFRGSLALWRAPALAGLTSAALGPQITGLEEKRLSVLEECFELELAVGRHQQLTAELAAHANENPLRERLTAQLMVALHRSGAPAQAALAYQRLVAALDAELQIEPGLEVRELHRRLTKPVAVQPAVAGLVRRSDLPRDVGYFTGRTAELDRLLKAAPGPGGTAMVVSAIDGMAGVGKTALAVHAAHRLATRFPDAQLFIDLHAHTPGHRPLSPAAALERLLRALGVDGGQIPGELEDRAALWRAQMARRRALVVLDNAADAAQVQPLLPGSADCRTLVTSRRRLTELDTTVLALDLMPLPDARELFTQAVGDDRPAEEPEATDEVLQSCGLLPLAIRIAAARLRHRPSWSVSHLSARLQDRMQRVAELETDGQNVAAAFNLSYEQLAAREKRVFHGVGLAPGTDIEPHAAGALTGLSPAETQDAMENLVDANLVNQPVPGRYHFHDLLRAYAVNLVGSTSSEGDRRAALTRLFDHYAASAAQAMDLVSPTEQAHRPVVVDRSAVTSDLSTYDRALAWLDAERANLIAMSNHAAAHGWACHATRISSTLWRYFHLSGHHSDALVVHTNALAAARAAGDIAYEADALASRGYIYWWLGRYPEALADCETAVGIATGIGDRSLEGRALHALGLVCIRIGADAKAEATLRCTIAAGRDTGDRVLEGYASRALGEVYHRLGRRADAVTSYRHAVTVAQETGNATIEGYAWRALGEIHASEGQHEKALIECSHALALARRIGNRNIENRALRTLGDIHRKLGNHGESSRTHEEALRLAQQTGNKYEEACVHDGIAHTCHENGDTWSATKHWRRALELFEELGVPERERVRARLDTREATEG